MLNFKFNKYFYISVIINFILLTFSFSSFSQQSKCNEIEKICLMLNQVVGIKTPMMVASGTIFNKDFIITNRHVIEDHKQVIIKFYDGSIKKAYPIPHNYPVDLVFLTLNKDRPLPYKLIDPYSISGMLRVVAFDQGRNSNRIYKKGRIIVIPDNKKNVQARIHTFAKSLPGNSGGAVVDDNGNLVGFLASGDGNINEVIPFSLLNGVLKNSDAKHTIDFFKTGKFIRLCADNLELAFNIQRNPDPELIRNITTNCWNSNNKQLIDQAGQTFGRLGDLKQSTIFLERSINLDPMSPNSLLSLAITYHIDRKIIKERPIINRLLKLIPEDPQVLRLGVQVSGILKDKKMSETILNLMSIHNKEALPLAKKFIDNAFKVN
tara:strand:- start:2454 stop:3587 length:1134 start_codon:yes stop_codon:yes gene_type:complete